jgi:hypothetical protein
LRYQDIILDEALHTECCQEAIKRGIPMDGKYSVLPYMDIGVAMIANAYAHIPERPTRVWICLVTAVVTGIDDHLGGGQDTEDMYRFNERFVNCHTQANPVLEALDTLLRETPRYYSPLASNLLTTSILDFMSSMLLDYKTKDMQVRCFSK